MDMDILPLVSAIGFVSLLMVGISAERREGEEKRRGRKERRSDGVNAAAGGCGHE